MSYFDFAKYLSSKKTFPFCSASISFLPVLSINIYLSITVECCYCSLNTTVIDIGRFILSAPEKDTDLSPVDEYETLHLMGDICAHAPADDAVPGWQVHVIELFLDNFCNVVKDLLLAKGKCYTVHGMLHHLWVHVCIFYHRILSLLLVNISMRLDNLFISLPLPGLGLISHCICANSR